MRYCSWCSDRDPDCLVCGRGIARRPWGPLSWEVFDPRTGRVVARCRAKLMARCLAWWFGLDYARAGCGHLEESR